MGDSGSDASQFDIDLNKNIQRQQFLVTTRILQLVIF